MREEEKFIKEIERISRRIEEYNAEFYKDNKLLEGLELKYLACKDLRIVKKWYTSSPVDEWLRDVFDELDKENKDNEIGIFRYPVKDIYIIENERVIGILETEFKNDMYLFVFQNIDINEDGQTDIKTLQIFKITKESISIDEDKIESFLKYTADYFTSPIIGDLLNNMELLENIYKDLRERIANYGHIVYRTIAGNMADFQAIDNAPDDAPIYTIRPYFNNIKKRLRYIDTVFKITAKEENEDKDIFVNVRTLGDLVCFIEDSYVLEKAKDMKLIFPAELKDIPFFNGYRHFFVLYWNLLHNADKHSLNTDKNIEICIYEEDNRVCLSFKNFADSEEIEYAINSYKDLEKAKANKGLGSIFKSTSKLNGEVGAFKIEKDDNYNFGIIVKIKKTKICK